jgi:hypothetical protein
MARFDAMPAQFLHSRQTKFHLQKRAHKVVSPRSDKPTSCPETRNSAIYALSSAWRLKEFFFAAKRKEPENRRRL